MLFTIEFFRLREEDDAHATLDRITHIGTELEAVKVKAKSLFETLNMPQKPDGLRILDQDGDEVFFRCRRCIRRALTRSRFAAVPATRDSSPRQLRAIVGQSERCLLGFCRRRASRSKLDPVPGSTSSLSRRRCPGSSGCRAIPTRPR